MQSAPKRACEIRIPYRDRRRPIYRTVELGGRNDVRDQPDEIVTLDPRDPLRTAADGSAEAKFEWRKQIAEHSGFGAKHDSDPQPNDAHSEFFSFSRRAFACLAHAVPEAALAAVELGQRFVVPCAV